MDLYKDVSEFFRIPQIDFSQVSPPLNIAAVTGIFNHEWICGIIPDREKFFAPHILQRALTFTDRDGRNGVLSFSSVTVDECEGHLPEQPMVPLIVLAKIMALNARFLSALHSGGLKVVCEVDQGLSRSLFTLKTLRYAVPPADVIAYSVIFEKNRRLVTTESRTWIIASHALVPAAEIVDFLYTPIPKRIYLAALRGEL